MKEALFYRKKEDNKVDCVLCCHYCRNIPDRGWGRCGVRQNISGVFYSLNYGVLAATNIDPIEKKPLFHFFPGSRAYSIACRGCNFKCGFCQNWQISQTENYAAPDAGEINTRAKDVVTAAADNKCKSIAYTYTEPTVYFEFVYDCAKLAGEKKIYNVLVTNGYMSKQALRYISPYLAAANVDLKSFQEEFYRNLCKASLKPVLENIVLMKELNIWVEITTLIIPGYNDSDKELKSIASFIFSLDKNIPWHISAFHPDYKFVLKEPTPLFILEKAYNIGKQSGLNFVYLGNTRTSGGENTYCPSCNKVIVEREGFFVKHKNIKEGKCLYCNEVIAGVGL